MASILLDVVIDCDVADAWEALRDFGALHTRLALDFVVACHVDSETRVVTFHNGMTVRERFVSSDDTRRRLVWSAIGTPFEHHNGAATVSAYGENRCLFAWQADLLPDALAVDLEPMMREGLAAIKRHLESGAARDTATQNRGGA